MINNELHQAYLETTYVVHTEDISFDILVEKKNKDFQNWCTSNKIIIQVHVHDLGYYVYSRPLSIR